MKELDIIILTVDVPELQLRAGAIGTIVMIHQGGVAFEVEFCAPNGETIAVETLWPTQIRPLSPDEMAQISKASDVVDSH